MKVVLLFLLFAPVNTVVGECYATSEEPATALAAYSRAAGQDPMSTTDDSNVRVWTRDYMLGRVDGFVISGNMSLRCRMSSKYADGVITLGPVKCHRVRSRNAAAKAIQQLPEFSRSQWDCPLMDGGEVFIERVRNNKISSIRVGNPEACEDQESKAIAKALRELW